MALLAPGPLPGAVPGSSTRAGPAYYRAGQSVTLTNQLSPLPNVGMQSLTENVPANWTATNISDFGTFEAGSGTIRWMFFDNQARPLRFTLLAPASASGAVALHGIASFDGQEAAVGGLAELVPPPPPAGTVVRHLPDTYRADTGFTVTLTVTPEAGIEFYTVAETVPSGWAVTTISNYGSFADGTIRWGPFTDAEARTLAYIVQAPVGAGSNAVFAGA
ncbi:MAG: hypothetical protein WCQ21_38035, partial [Verrucomicrobiota bacterium]